MRVLIQRASFARESGFFPSSLCFRTAEEIVDRAQNLFNICEHLVVPESKDPVALRIEKRGADFIFARSLGMLSAIEFDDKASFRRAEVSEVRSDRELTAKLGLAHLTAPQMSPQDRSASVCSRRRRRAFCWGDTIERIVLTVRQPARKDKNRILNRALKARAVIGPSPSSSP